MSITSNPELMEGFHLCNPESLAVVERKIGELTLGHIVVADVDLTLTTNEYSPADADVSSWGVFREQLSPEAQAVDDALYRMFRPREQNNSLNLEDSEYWWNATLGLYVRDGVSITAAQEAARNIRMRPGAVALSKLCSYEEVPQAWLSAGIRDVIELLAKQHCMQPDAILATKLVSDSVTGIVTGWNPETLVHPHNKNEQGLGKITSLRRSDPITGLPALPGTLLLGDNIHDTRMVDGDDVLRIRVAADRHRDIDEEDYRSESHEAGYDLVIKQQGLEPVVELIDAIAKRRKQPSL